ncbi:hypothetical protein COY91_03200 [Candidatus Shapirobacteria bacterium CG_4_10_14_0_8_um_filter_39_15]|nr:MAG: hypothetical protein COY91_03200 [Candidatus Shapirobacteria bacterium CG_4_10_14_0_8_um_filter_39_15]PJE68057.1 MAG: hypothetical protein COU94_03830 [Candidatus Shapirobacteria bacterium CG10_big_fil_rev_8_21_14_0_10_38_8]
MEITQLILVLVIVLLASVLTVIGVEVFFILKEFRFSVKKMNKILDDAGLISESVAKPIADLSGFISGLKSGAHLMKFISRFTEEEEKKHD